MTGWTDDDLPDSLHRCEACGKFVSDDHVWGDHDKQGCKHRPEGHPCAMPDGICGVDMCGCLLSPFCSEVCADRWHQ